MLKRLGEAESEETEPITEKLGAEIIMGKSVRVLKEKEKFIMKPYLLGIDIGTSACKVAVFEKSGTVVAAANGDYPVYYPKEGWAEQNRKNGGVLSSGSKK